jgi:hypothetical protein
VLLVRSPLAGVSGSAPAPMSSPHRTDATDTSEDDLDGRGIGFAFAAWFVDPHRNSIGLLQFKA